MSVVGNIVRPVMGQVARGIGRRSGGGSWTTPFLSDVSFLMSEVRSDNKMLSTTGDDVDILLPYFNGGSDRNAYISDNGALDIGNTDFTLCGWVKTESTSVAASRYLVGKNIALDVDGRYGIYLPTTGMLSCYAEPTGGIKVINSTVNLATAGDTWYYFRMDINQSTKKIRFYINEGQIGADVDYTGTFPALANQYKFWIGAGNAALTGAVSNVGLNSCSDIYVFNKILNPTEAATLYARGRVAGAKAAYPCESAHIGRVADVSGNNYHLTCAATSNTYRSYGEGSRYNLLYGYTRYSNGYNDYCIPLSLNDADVQSITFPLVGIKKITNITGGELIHNNTDCILSFTADQFDRSSTTIYEDLARDTTYTYYDSANPKRWHISEFNNLDLISFLKTNHKGTVFARMTGNSYYKRESLLNIFTYTTNKTGADYIRVLSSIRDYNYSGIYENDNIYWRYDTDAIIAARGSKQVKWVDAATDTLHLSIDSGGTYPYSINSPINGQVPQFAHIFANGNILIAGVTKLYLSTDNLTSFTEITAIGIDGNPYSPTNYCFSVVTPSQPVEVDGQEILVWGCYRTLVNYGDTDINVWYSVDNGATVKSAYKAGVTNPPNLPARHIHYVAYRQSDDSFWVTTGDNFLGGETESNILKGNYDWDLDSWTWEKLYGDAAAGNTYKIISVNFYNDSVLVGDDNTSSIAKRGLWVCPIADLASSANFSVVFSGLQDGADSKMIGDEILGRLGFGRNQKVLASSNGGPTGIVGNKLSGGGDIRNFYYIIDKVDNGWYLCHIQYWGQDIDKILGNPVVWVKIK